MSPWKPWRVVEGYLKPLPGALKEERLPVGSTAHRCVHTPDPWAPTATLTLLLDTGVGIIEVKESTRTMSSWTLESRCVRGRRPLQ